MKMNYDGTLLMPSNYVVMDKEEMTYVDGGGELWIQISNNSLIISILSALGGALTKSTAEAALAAAGAAIATAIELGTAGTGTLYVGAFLIAWGSVVPIIASAAVTYGINSLKGKKFKICDVPFLPDFTLKI
ncbi:hypothetical protein [Acetivibrio clariflavus]|uniref:Uncharacterized protein n=1 Tax=Acetivibrio clariflavus (strain DSM 19732 / NBRC 101661 / EBR45) TaxID=720554 RepID=G8LWD8_ACECE|nr:hypothetical protein [Acetivibrio clariflavus]AEV67564.1 hypothetical protein Clocl_0882 [Acetivibrio clariflavus DSM 19732]